jgi:hypothetical protein
MPSLTVPATNIDFNKTLICVPCLTDAAGKERPKSQFQVAKRRSYVGRKTSGNRVLMIGRIRELALYRAEVLRARGFEATTPESQAEAVAAVRKGTFDVAVLTYTLSNDAVQELAELIRKYRPDCPLIAISSNQRIDRVILPDEMVNANDGPAALVAALRKLTGQH